MSWNIIEKNGLDMSSIDQAGSKFLLGNGYIGYRGTLEEHSKLHKTGTIINGLYDRVGDKWREPVNAPNGLFVQLFCNEKPVNASSCMVTNHTRTLDMKSAVISRVTEFVTINGNKILVKTRRFVSLKNRHLICLEYSFLADKPCRIMVRTGIDADVWDLNGPHLEKIECSQNDDIISVSAVTHEQKKSVAVSEAVCFQGHNQEKLIDEKGILRELELTVEPGKEYGFTKYCTVVTGLDCDDPGSESAALAGQAAKAGFETLLEEHREIWQKRWDLCDIRIKGDEEAEKALRFSMYHLLAISPAHSDKVSIPARGLSGQVYKGGIFWDTEIFMLPFFMHSFPETARNLLMYRYHTLDGARRKAAEYGYRGAFYAWESQDSGDDACTHFNITDVFTGRPMRTYFRDKQVHISADIVYAFWQYYLITGDGSLFIDGGAEVIYECTRFFISHIYYKKDKKRYEVLDVTGPDEYHERVSNNAFTNMMVKFTFEVCRKVKELLEKDFPSFQADLVKKLDMEDELAEIDLIGENLYIPAPREKDGVIPQFDGYFDLEDVSLGELKKRILHENEYLGGGNGPAVNTTILKQADVVLAMMLFDKKYPRSVKKANWEFYEKRTEHGSSLSACAYAITAARNGNTPFAYDYFMKTATIDLTGKSKQYVGDLYIGGTHPAANGGAWMSMVKGLCGIEYTNKKLSINPGLPAHWQKVTVPLKIGKGNLKIEMDSQNITVFLSGEVEKLKITSGGKEFMAAKKEVITIPLKKADKPRQVSPTRAAIFDLDGVIVDTAKYHYLAWKKLADQLGVPFDISCNQRLKGVDRMGSLEIILEMGNITMELQEKEALAALKNSWYVEYIHNMDSSELLPGAFDYIRKLRKKNIKTALGSASKNAAFILEKLQITDLFDAVIDGTKVQNSKPDPEVFLLAAEELGEKPKDCVVFEDALSGVEAARSAGMKVIGIGEETILKDADYVISGLYELTG